MNELNQIEAKGLVYIGIDNIFPHPNNPRKDLGDLSELAESIKTNGIFQNLTVVPKDAIFDKHSAIGKSEDMGNPTGYTYTVIIGHRRLAASKLAGLTEVPCVISSMSPKEQLATMLMENMQRNDLTVYEQAQGFQMMLNLGDSVKDISERTGFSSTTVRRRVKLLELDQEKLRKSVERGGNLQDYMELNKIEDISLRNSILDKVGTPNFQYEVKRAIDKEKEDKVKADLIAQLETFATKIDNSTGLRYIRQYYGSNMSDFTMPDDAATAKYYYRVESWGISLYGEQGEASAPDTAYSELQEKRRAAHAALKEISDRAYQLRRDFISIFTNANAKAKEHMSTIIEYAVCGLLDEYKSVDYPSFAEMLKIKLDNNNEWEFSDIVNQLREQPERYLLVATFCTLDNNEEYFNWQNNYEPNGNIDRVYDFLEALGYEASDEEKTLRDGSHELFVSEEVNG